MFDYLLAIISGLIQGLTEFLPVSSSGHLIIFHEWFNFYLADTLTFDVVLHLGTLMALLLFFWKDIMRLISAWFFSLLRLRCKNSQELLSWMIFVGTIPAVLVGYYFNDILDFYFRNLSVVVVTLILISLLMIMVEQQAHLNRGELKDLNFKQALWIGFAQATALIPGVSRSGITIITGMSQGLKREAAARYSFLLSIPIVFGAGVKKMWELGSVSVANPEVAVLIIGFLVSALVGFLTIKYFLKFLQKNSLRVFAWYRILLALAVLISLKI